MATINDIRFDSDDNDEEDDDFKSSEKDSESEHSDSNSECETSRPKTAGTDATKLEESTPKKRKKRRSTRHKPDDIDGSRTGTTVAADTNIDNVFEQMKQEFDTNQKTYPRHIDTDPFMLTFQRKIPRKPKDLSASGVSHRLQVALASIQVSPNDIQQTDNVQKTKENAQAFAPLIKIDADFQKITQEALSQLEKSNSAVLVTKEVRYAGATTSIALRMERDSSQFAAHTRQETAKQKRKVAGQFAALDEYVQNLRGLEKITSVKKSEADWLVYKEKHKDLDLTASRVIGQRYEFLSAAAEKEAESLRTKKRHVAK